MIICKLIACRMNPTMTARGAQIVGKPSPVDLIPECKFGLGRRLLADELVVLERGMMVALRVD